MALSTTQYGYIIDPMVPFTDDKGKTIKNGFVRVFVAGSSTPVVTYRNFDGATNQDRIELDNSGRTKTSVIGSKGLTYKVCVYDKHHSQESPILTVDKVSVIGANITAGSGATVVTGLDGLTTKPDGFVDASVVGTDGYVALDHTLVTDDLDTDAKVTAVEDDRYVPLLNEDVNDPDSKMTLGRLWQWVLGKIKNLSTTITSFRTGDVIPVDGPSGTAKMSKDDLLKETAENALQSTKNEPSSVDFSERRYIPIVGQSDVKKTPYGIIGKDLLPISWTDGKYVNKINGYNANADNYSATDYFDIEGATDIYIVTSATGDNSGYAFYDKRKTFILGANIYGYDTGHSVSVPNGAKYVRFTCFTEYKGGASISVKNVYGMAAKINNIINGNVSTKEFSAGDCSRYGITKTSGVYKIPISFDGKYSLHFEFKFPKTIHTSASEITILDLPKYANNENNGGIIAKVYPQAQTTSGSYNQAVFPAYFKCAPFPYGFGNTNSAEHKPSSGVTYKQFIGDDLFSIRYLGNDNDVVYDITDGGLEIKHSGGATIASVSFPVDKNYATFISDLNTACDSGALQDVIELSVFVSDGITTDDIARVASVPLCSSDYPSYVVGYDNSWHSIDVRFNASGTGGNEILNLSLDGLPLTWTYALFSRSYADGNETNVYVGAQDFEVRNFVFNKDEAKSLEPKILVYYAHGLEDGPNDNSSTSGASVKLGRMEAVIKVHEDNGFVPVSYRKIQDYLVKGSPIPDKCWTIIHDDSYYFQSLEDGSLSLKFRNLYKRKGLHASFGIIGQNWGISQDLRDTGKLDTRTFDFVLHDQPGYNTMTYAQARANLLSVLGVFRNVFGDTDTWVYPNGVTTPDLLHLVRELGFSSALIVGGHNTLIASKRSVLQGVMRNEVTSYGTGFNFSTFESRIKLYASL